MTKSRSASLTSLDVAEPRLLVGLILFALVLGGLLELLASGGWGDLVWAAATALALIPLSWSVARSLARGDVGVDAIALVAMAGALALGEYLAGAVIALMLSGGNALEAAAGRRARKELTALLSAPRGSRTAAVTASSRRCRSRRSGR